MSGEDPSTGPAPGETPATDTPTDDAADRVADEYRAFVDMFAPLHQRRPGHQENEEGRAQ